MSERINDAISPTSSVLQGHLNVNLAIDHLRSCGDPIEPSRNQNTHLNPRAIAAGSSSVFINGQSQRLDRGSYLIAVGGRKVTASVNRKLIMAVYLFIFPFISIAYERIICSLGTFALDLGDCFCSL